MDINTRLVKPTSFNKFCLRKILQYIINEGYFYNISFEFRGTLGGYWRNSEPQMINNVDLISIQFRSQSTYATILLFETNLENHFVKIPVLNSQCFSLEILLFLLTFFKSNQIEYKFEIFLHRINIGNSFISQFLLPSTKNSNMS
jgi:hypothetical protein